MLYGGGSHAVDVSLLFLCRHPGYNVGHSIIPHGISVIVNAPAVFRYTAPTNPERHLQAASMLGADTSKAKAPDAGAVLADTILRYMHALDVPDGLSALGYVLLERALTWLQVSFDWAARCRYSSSDIPKLVQGTLPQKRYDNTNMFHCVVHCIRAIRLGSCSVAAC